MNKNPKYQIVYELLKKQLIKLPDGGKLPSVRTLMVDYKVSLATLNSALDLLKIQGYIELVPCKGIFKRESKIGRVHKQAVTLLLPGQGECLFSKIIAHCHDALSRFDFKLNIVVYDLNENSESESLKAQTYDDAAGIIYMPTFEGNNTVRELKKLVKVKPLIQIDREIGQKISSVVGYELMESSWKATKLLIDHGCRQIGLIAPIEKSPDQYERIIGFKKALNDHGMVCNPAYNISYDGTDIYVSTDIDELMKRRNRPDGFFAVNAVFLPRLFGELAKLGLTIPYDVAVTSFDISETFKNLHPQVTHIVEPIEAVVERAVEILTQYLLKGGAKKYREFFSGKLMSGKSCAFEECHTTSP